MNNPVMRFLLAVLMIILAGGCASTTPTPVEATPPSTVDKASAGAAAAPTTTASPTTPPSPTPAETAAPTSVPTATLPPQDWVELKSDLASSPPPRTDLAMVMLPDGSVLMFGGLDENGNSLGDTWILALDGTTQSVTRKAPGFMSLLPRLRLDWNPINPRNAPVARYGQTAISSNGNVYVFGGGDNQQLFNDLYKYTGDWEQIEAVTPPPAPRRDHLAWASGEDMYVMGGIGGNTLFQDLWRYNIPSNRWEQLADPPGFISPNAFPALMGGKVIFLDPHVQASKGTPIYIYNPETGEWELNESARGVWPEGERSYMQWAQNGDQVFMVGGAVWDGAAQAFSSVAESWVYNLATSNWTQMEALPNPLSGGAAVYDPGNQRLVVWGGQTLPAGTFYGGPVLLGYYNSTLVANE